MSSEAQQSVNYEPLPTSRAIRLLHLQPARRLKAPLVATLEVVSLDSTLQYEALSYAWDGAFNTSVYQQSEPGLGKCDAIPLTRGQMYLDGCLISITGNLRDALRRLRLRSKTRLLWIDAVCISQGNKLEQSAQVAIMADIYSTADRVIVWLGEESDDRDGELFLRPYRKCPRGGINRSIWRSIFWDIASLAEPLQAKVKWNKLNYWWHQREYGIAGRSSHIDPLAIFRRRRYFSRRWCVREVAVAKNVVVFCGAYQMSWTQLLLSVKTFEYWNVTVGKILRALENIRQEGATALLMLQRISSMRCSDERDYLYALASLLERDPRCPAIKIDYTISWQQVFTSFVADYLQGSPLETSWQLLGAAAYQRSHFHCDYQSDDLPSWVIDFRKTVKTPMWEASGVHSKIDPFRPRRSKIGETAIRDGILETHLVYCGKFSSSSAHQKQSSRPVQGSDCVYTLAADMFESGASLFDRYLALRPVAGEADTFRLVGMERKFEEAERMLAACYVHKIFII